MRTYMKGNEALAYGALDAGLNAFFGYPITPSSEIPETLARVHAEKTRASFRVFMQAASETESINMVIGSASTGSLAMTATSGPGFSLMQEAMSYAAGMELPFVVVNVNRAGPGLGNIGPEQSDYHQCTRGGGHGSYRNIVLAPNSVQEMANAPSKAFDLAFRYRNPVIILADAFIGQLKEDIEFPSIEKRQYDVSWAVGGKGKRVINSIFLDHNDLERHNMRLQDKFCSMGKEADYEEYLTDDAEIIVIAYGISSRISMAAINDARKKGIRAGILRPKTLFPFPSEAVKKHSDKEILVVEMNDGQMTHDVMLASGKRVNGHYRMGGNIPAKSDIAKKLEEISNGILA